MTTSKQYAEHNSREFTERVARNQTNLISDLKRRYDFIVCGAGSSGSVVARRLAENPDVTVLLIEAGGSDDVPSVLEANQWPLNLGSERDWNFRSQRNPRLNGRSISLSMGKVLGGGSGINVMVWARGHKEDWDFFGSEADDPAWNYNSVLNIYRRIEDWHGAPDPQYRGTGGLVFVEPAPDPNPVAPAMVEGARSVGIPTFENQNGRMMESSGGASIIDVRCRNGKRLSVFRSYCLPIMDQPNLTVLTHALVARVVFDKHRAIGVEIVHEGKTRRIAANAEVILSLGAIHTPKLLMQSGIGDQAELQRHGIPVLHHLPGVGQNYQPGEAARLAGLLAKLNDERREIEQRMQLEAVGLADDMHVGDALESLGVCLFDESWHQGVVGLVAGRIKDRLHRPVIAFARAEDGSLRGSARSVSGVNIRDALDSIAARQPGLIDKFGGHAMAAGLTLREGKLTDFKIAFAAEIAARTDRDSLTGVIYSDGALSAEELCIETAQALRGAGPWGQGFPEPVFDGEFKVVDARIVGGKHMKLRLDSANRGSEPIDAIAFGYVGGTSEDATLRCGSTIQLAYRLEINEFRGAERVQLNCQHLKIG